MKFDENEEEPLTTPDTENSTRLNHQEGRDPKQDYGPGDYWTRLSNINAGAADSYGNRNEKLARKQERLVAFDVMSDHLHLSGYQKRRGRRIMGEVSAKDLGVTIHFAAYCLSALVVNADDRVDRDYHPSFSDGNNCEFFLEVADDFDYSANRIHSVLNRLDAQVNV